MKTKSFLLVVLLTVFSNLALAQKAGVTCHSTRYGFLCSDGTKIIVGTSGDEPESQVDEHPNYCLDQNGYPIECGCATEEACSGKRHR